MANKSNMQTVELGVKGRKSKNTGLKIAEQQATWRTSKFSSNARKLFLWRLLVNDLQSSHRLKNKWTSCGCYKCGLRVWQHWTSKVGREKSRSQGLESEEWQRNPETLWGCRKDRECGVSPHSSKTHRKLQDCLGVCGALKHWMPKLSIYLSGRWKQSWRTTLDKDAHTNLTLSSAISGHCTTSQPQRPGSNSWCCRKERAAFCLGYSMVEKMVFTEACQKGKKDLEL